ncbi:MAG: zinc dependent phospholipase C family protein [Deltaproteobacteria bacterium]|nr:zinc dependent phospholipase C family protein [Deltaproteobacteria bacterium]
MLYSMGKSLLVVSVVFASTTGHAYDMPSHIKMANALRRDLISNVKHGRGNVIRLISPSGKARAVRLHAKDAEAILKYPEYFRGGTTGPDNTVATRMTDLTHAPKYRPYQQSEALYRAAVRREKERGKGKLKDGKSKENLSERAYALGTFLHLAGDNALHHLVNTITGETFTFHPKDHATKAQLAKAKSAKDLPKGNSNMLRHIALEKHYNLAPGEGYLTVAERKAGASSKDNPADLSHKLAKGLIENVYYDPSNTKGVWGPFSDGLLTKTRQALQASLGDGASNNIREGLIAKGASQGIRKTTMETAKTYLKVVKQREGGAHNAVLLVPQLVQDLGALYDIVNEQGKRRVETHKSGWAKKLLSNVFVKKNRDGKSNFEQRSAEKKEALAKLMPTFLRAVEKLSKIDVEQGLPTAKSKELHGALNELFNALFSVVSVDPTILLSPKARVVTKKLLALTKPLGAIFRPARNRLLSFFAAKKLASFVKGLGPENVKAKAYVEQKLTEMVQERGMSTAPKLAGSVLEMNTWNTMVAVLGDHNVVVDTSAPLNFEKVQAAEGPVTVDGSYQLEYNLVARDPALAKIFYPKGISASEMIQPVAYTAPRNAKSTAAPVETKANGFLSTPNGSVPFKTTGAARQPRQLHLDIVELND